MVHRLLAALFALAAFAACTPVDDADDADTRTPAAPSVVISRAAPRTGDDLVLQPIPESPDSVDGSTLSVAWFRDNAPIVSLTDALIVPASETRKGQTWVARVAAIDALGVRGPTASVQVVVGNTPPEVQASLRPSVPTTGDPLALQVQTNDADDDPVTVQITWQRNGDADPAYDNLTTIPDSETTRGQTWTAHLVPSDGEASGEPVQLDTAVINAAPWTRTVSLKPTHVREGTTLLAAGTAVDPEGDELTVEWSWTVNGVLLDGPTGSTLTGAWFNKGDDVRALLTPVDATGARGVATPSGPRTILNTPPSLFSAAVSPPEGDEHTVFSCVPLRLEDVDTADTHTLTATWVVDGRNVPGQQLTGASFKRGDLIFCYLSAHDGIDSSSNPASPALRIGNTPPSLQGVTLDPSDPTSGTPLTAVPAGGTDPDGDAVSYSYAWWVNGARIDATEPTLPAATLARGDEVFVQVTPSDGLADGAPVYSNPLTLGNGAPQLADVAWSPAHPNPHEDLALTLTATDPDGDAFTLVYQWTVNGIPAGGNTASLPRSAFTREDAVSVVVQATDALGATSTASLNTVMGNAPPTSPTVVLEPADPLTGDALLCSLTRPGTDPDGDAVTHSFAWTVNDTPYTGAFSDSSSSLVEPIATRGSDVWTCTGLASDGSLSSPSAPATVTIADVSCGALAHDDGLGTCVCEVGTRWCDASEVDCCEAEVPEFNIAILHSKIAPQRADLTAWDPPNGLPDAYVQLSVSGVVYGTTSTVVNSLEPVWTQPFSAVPVREGETVLFTVNDADVPTDELIQALPLTYAQIVAAADGPSLTINGFEVHALVVYITSR